MEGQTTGILEEKLKLEAEVGTLKEQLEKRGNEVEASYLKTPDAKKIFLPGG